VLLSSEEDQRVLPIFIGAAEAQSIAIWMNKISVPRPLTHDLLKNTLDFMECRLLRIEVWNLEDGTFFARLILSRDGTEMMIDARPSDAIALALRCEAPIYVSSTVMNEAGRILDAEEGAGQKAASPTGAAAAKPPEERMKLTPLEALQQRLDEAVKDERYEDAAHLRDEINRIKDTNTKN
jgi:bifunctional DNase/RNase